MFTPRIMVIIMSKMAHFCNFCQWQQKISHSLGKMFKYIWKIWLGSFKKCYGATISKLLGVVIYIKMNSFFSSVLWALPVDIFHFCISRTTKFRSPLCIMFWSVKYTFTYLNITLSKFWTKMSFFYDKFANFWYVTYECS